MREAKARRQTARSRRQIVEVHDSLQTNLRGKPRVRKALATTLHKIVHSKCFAKWRGRWSGRSKRSRNDEERRCDRLRLCEFECEVADGGALRNVDRSREFGTSETKARTASNIVSNTALARQLEIMEQWAQTCEQGDLLAAHKVLLQDTAKSTVVSDCMKDITQKTYKSPLHMIVSLLLVILFFL